MRGCCGEKPAVEETWTDKAGQYFDGVFSRVPARRVAEVGKDRMNAGDDLRLIEVVLQFSPFDGPGLIDGEIFEQLRRTAVRDPIANDGVFAHVDQRHGGEQQKDAPGEDAKEACHRIYLTFRERVGTSARMARSANESFQNAVDCGESAGEKQKESCENTGEQQIHVARPGAARRRSISERRVAKQPGNARLQTAAAFGERNGQLRLNRGTHASDADESRGESERTAWIAGSSLVVRGPLTEPGPLALQDGKVAAQRKQFRGQKQGKTFSIVARPAVSILVAECRLKFLGRERMKNPAGEEKGGTEDSGESEKGRGPVYDQNGGALAFDAEAYSQSAAFAAKRQGTDCRNGGAEDRDDPLDDSHSRGSETENAHGLLLATWLEPEIAGHTKRGDDEQSCE